MRRKIIKQIKESNPTIKNLMRFFFFCFIGGISFLIDWSFFNLFYHLSKNFLLSVTLSAMISMVFNFSVNRNVTFSARGHSVKKQIFRWLIIYLIAFLVRIGVGNIILLCFEENILIVNIAYIIGIIVAIPISFLGSLLWAFKKK